MTEILQIPSAMARDVWGQALPLLATSIDMAAGRYLPEDVLQFCEAGNLQLWLIAIDNKIVAAAVTEIVIYPRKKVVRVAFAGGSMAKQWAHALDEKLEAFGRHWGCTATEAAARRGWNRLLNAEQLGVFIAREYEMPPLVSEEVH
jgi:hypothetical protein